MPIRKENRHYYAGPEWQAIRKEILERAGNKCEGSPNHYPCCQVPNGRPHPVTGSIVVLTIAHLDQNPANNERSNLRALCQRCHLIHDRDEHLRVRKLRERLRKKAAGQLELDLI